MNDFGSLMLTLESKKPDIFPYRYIKRTYDLISILSSIYHKENPYTIFVLGIH